jgi:dTDP-3-amino-3,4,6-trideoxy-alpha-D-glucose transaminase
MSRPPRILFSAPGPREDGATVRQAIERVLSSGWYVLGPELEAFEAEFAAASGASHAVGVGSGTDAIALALRALGIGSGDEVITTPLSAAYTGLAIMLTGACPVFADIDAERLTIDPDAVTRAITPRTRAVVPVHLYGQPADTTAIERVAFRHGLALVEDCCQAHLATCAGRPVGTFGAAGAFSFYPTKNLGALGDGGAVVTNDAALADRVRRLRNGGQIDRYHHIEAGVNSRLDELQAAVLRARLPYLAGWTADRRRLAAVYRTLLEPAAVKVPKEHDPGHVYHLFVVRAAGNGATGDRRADLQDRLATEGIQTFVHYPVPLPQQPAFAAVAPTDCPAASAACRELLSLPLHPHLDENAIATVASVVCGLPHPDRQARQERTGRECGH